MEIKKAKPTSPGRRHVVRVKNTELHTVKPFKGLVEVKKSK
ncbi:50S ribosomal protein L2, partial [Francisella tularensis subsp. holarctica]|nr:50S ribosomal protein L2 [Francisella tularensis subsp. holarctica]